MSKKKEFKNISAIKRQIVAAIMMLVMNNGDTLWATTDHPFFINGKYVAAQELNPGDQFSTYDGSNLFLKEKLSKDTSIQVYNLTVADNANYYVGRNPVLVHNSCFLNHLDNYPVLKATVNDLDEGLKGEFIKDFFKAGDDVLDKLNKSPGMVSAWKRANRIFPKLSKFNTDIPTLQQIDLLSSPTSGFRLKLKGNWSDVLDDILKNSDDLKCSSCGNSGRIGRSSIDQFLQDVDHFITNFDVEKGGKGEVFYNWIRNINNPTPGQIDELHQTIRDFAKRGIKEADVIALGKQFPSGVKKYDLRRIGDKYTEYKNKDYVTYPLSSNSDDVDQFINGYLVNIKNLDDFEMKIGFDKLKSSWPSEDEALRNMRNQWKSVFKIRSQEIYNANPILFNKMKLNDGTLVSDLDLFLEYLDDISESDLLFNFIKVE